MTRAPIPLLSRLKDWASRFVRNVLALWLAARDRRVPWAARLMALLVAGYALSPIDLIPDFVPVLGLLDDLLLVPGGVWFALRLVPTPLMAELREQASRIARPRSSAGAAIIVLIWLAAAVAAWAYLSALR